MHQCLKLKFQYHYPTPYQDYNDWVYNLTYNGSNQVRRVRHLEPDFLSYSRCSVDYREMASYTRKKTYDDTLTSDSPSDKFFSHTDPYDISIQAIKN